MPTGIYIRTPEMIRKSALAHIGIKHKKHKLLSEEKKHKGICRNTGKTHFKKGMIPWNKGVKGVMKPPWNKGTKGVMPPAWNKGKYGLWSGKDNPNWKGGTSENYRIRRTSKYKEWRNFVFNRDKYVCQECGGKGYVTAHHIKSISNFPNLALDINNGKTLCEPCHAQTDNYKGRARRIIQ